MSDLPPLDAASLPIGVRARHIDAVNGLRMHVLEAGYDGAQRPLVLLLHGFPELAYSWRKMMLPLAAAGFHVVAPDQRGYGRTIGWSNAYDQDLRPFSMLSLARDALALVRALGHARVHTVIGHDFGSPVAAWCALVRPDVFGAVVLMSAPFAGAPPLTAQPTAASPDIAAALAALPRPRKHYHWYYATRAANADMQSAPQGVHDFLRAYFHHKSAEWAPNKPYKLVDWSAGQLAQMPTYYIMDQSATMAATVAPFMPDAASIAQCRWLPDRELAVYADAYTRTGFQGGLNWYRTRFDDALNAELSLFSGKSIDVPSMFVAGASDWGVQQAPGAYERMQSDVCTKMSGCHLVDGAGHWVMQEQPEATARLLVDFCSTAAR